ncbi:DUF5011 domain-containing protein, partial [Breznakia sp. OttesenSCG-928-G09]|nr:DUF5011 domain-containing protein [Breznakia sp. OttesenSCG-928-G09]
KLDVYNFHVSQDELADLDEAVVIEKAQIQAMYFEQDDEGVKKLEDITKMVRAGSLDEIKQAPGEGNVYKLSFHVTSEGITETKEIEVVVSGNSIVVTDGLVIEANDFSIANVLARILVKEKALELANAKAYELETRQMLNNISIDTDQLDAIHNVTNDAQTFKLTYTATHNNKTVSIEKDVRVNHTLIGPDITADDCEHYVGDKFEVLHDVSAKDANDDTIHFITDPEHPDKNIETTHQIPLDSDKFNTSGTYKITYAIMDKYGNTSEKIRTVKVHDVPVIEVNPQVYTLKDKDVADQMKAAASAYYYKAADVAGEPSIKTKIDEINYTSNGPSQDFSKVGTYEVTYEVELIDGRNVTKKVNVIITKNDSLPTDVDKGIKLDVYNFHVSQDELVDLDEAAVLEKAQAQAMYFENDDKGNVIKLDDITAKVVVGSLVDIKKASAEGGVYKLSFSVSDNKMVETKEVEVVVSGKSIKFENGVVLKANDITLPNADAKKITESKLLNLAGAQAYVLETNQQINVTADPIQLEAIKNVGNDKVSYPLNLSSTYDTTTIEMSIQVGVEHTLVKPIVKVVNKAVYVGDVYDMFEGVTAEDANNQLLVLDDDNTKVTHQMPLEDSKFKIVGTYQVVYEVKDKYGNVGEAKQKIRVNGLPELNTNPQTYALNDPDIMNKVEVNAFARYQKASEKIGGEPVWIELDISSEVIDGPDGDLQFNNIGIYIVKYATTNEDNRTTKKTTSVAVIHQGDIPDPTSLAYISAKGFIIDYTSVESLDEATILDSNHADVKAFKVLHDDNQQVIGSQDITDKVYVDKDKLAEIQKTNSNGKIYQLALRVEDDGNIVTRVINVVVSGSEVPIPQPTPDGNYLVITANDFRLTYDEAKNADETMVSEKANVKAMLLQPEMKNNIVKRMAATNAPLSVRINKRELQNIREVPELGGNYQLTFFAEYRLLDQLVAVNPISVNVKIVPKSSDDLYGNVINEKTKKEPKGMDKVIETGDTQTGWLWIVTMVLSFMFITKKGWKLLTKNKSSKK